MYGSLAGNIIAAVFFLVFQIVGISIAIRILKTESLSFQILIGSVLGSFSLHWLPTIYSLFIGFHKGSNLLGLFSMMIIGIMVYINFDCNKTSELVVHKRIWLIIIPTFIYVVFILLTHTLAIKDGAMYTGQSTFGDMNLHLGIITSIANQGKFPPDYSIFPGTKLSYPFLSDSISSSLYVFGASLKFSYIFPMLFAMLQVFYGFYLFAYGWLKNQTTAILAWILFFFNGGFGVFYFLNGAIKNPSNFTRIFTEFYNTPTNFMDINIRWVNVIVDMLIPQRATLFGYAMLFPILSLLYKAVFEEQKKYFVLLAILISGLPMIHTHSFLVVGIICAVWCLITLFRSWRKIEFRTGENVLSKEKAVLLCSMIIYLAGMEYISLHKQIIPEKILFMIPVLVIALFLLMGLYLLYKQYSIGDYKTFLETWGILLLIIVIPVTWQLFTWTFKQASSGNFVKGHFNWVNEVDSYIWFYVKNMGLVALCTVPAILKSEKKWLLVFSPALLIWFIAEFIVFQPNSYDNNKLLYPAYGFLCCIVAAYLISMFQRIRETSYKKVVAGGILLLLTTSALLTMIREAKSEYQLYSKEQIELSEYIEENLPEDSVVLTDGRHNNAISSLTGRNIVCGTGSFLYFHGINYSKRVEEVQKIYEDVVTNEDLLEKNHIDYILVGDEERYSFANLNEELIKGTYLCVYQQDKISLYTVLK